MNTINTLPDKTEESIANKQGIPWTRVLEEIATFNGLDPQILSSEEYQRIKHLLLPNAAPIKSDIIGKQVREILDMVEPLDKPVDYFLDKGEAALEVKNLIVSQEYFEKALRVTQYSSDTFIRIIKRYFEKGYKTQAYHIIEEVQRLHPNNLFIQHLLILAYKDGGATGWSSTKN